MRTVRLMMLLLLIMLTLFFNIERLNWNGTENPVNIQTFTYVLAIGAVVAALLNSPLNRTTAVVPLTFWFALYFLLKFFAFTSHPLSEGTNSYLLITEITFLAALTTLAHAVSKNLKEVEKAVQDNTLANGLDFITVAHAQNIIHSELTRSRHYNRELSMITVEVEPTSIDVNDMVREMQSAFAQRYAVTRVAQEIRSQLRETDQVFLGNKPNQVVILCPETGRTDSETIFNQIQPLVLSHVDVKLNYGVATFPDNGVTLNGLLTYANHVSRKVVAANGLSDNAYVPNLGTD